MHYTYYPTGLRKTKTANLAVTNYVWDGSNMVLEYTNSAASGKVYVYGFTLISQGNSLYYIYNAHGDVVKYMNSAGTVLKSYEYDAFGEEINASAADANPFRYAGQYFDTETGTYYLRARYYSPALGRFTQQDAWAAAMPGIALSLNLYVYCMGNPVAFVDITGYWPSWSQVGTAAAIVAVSAVAVVAIVATAGAAGAAIGTGIAMYVGASAATAATLSTAATVGCYAVAAGVAAVAVSDAGEVLTGHNVIRDDLMGGNQAAYDATKLVLGVVGDAIVQTGVNSSYRKITLPKAKAYSGHRNPKADFVNGTKLEKHYTKHATSVGVSTSDDYVKAAEHFLTKEPTKTTQSFVSNGGYYFRYDTATNEFWIMNEFGGISTYFKPDLGINYWYDQIDKFYKK